MVKDDASGIKVSTSYHWVWYSHLVIGRQVYDALTVIAKLPISFSPVLA